MNTWSRKTFADHVKYMSGAHEYTIRAIDGYFFIEHLHDGDPVTWRATLKDAKLAADEIGRRELARGL